MSTEEIIQRTRLLDSEIKVGAQLLCGRWGPLQDRPQRSESPLLLPSRAPWGRHGARASPSYQEERKEN